MNGAVIDPVHAASSTPFHMPPCPTHMRLEQAPEGSSRFVLLAVLFPILLALITPFGLVFSRMISDPAARHLVADRPLLAVQLGLGLIVLASIFGWPLAHLAKGALRRRVVRIENGRVSTQEMGVFGRYTWTEPLSAYAGVARRFRTSLSGARQELVLVHQRPSRTVILQSSTQISQDAVDSTARLFGLAEIPSREAANFTPLHGHFRLAEPQTRLSAAHA
jgi:hypothetical protein